MSFERSWQLGEWFGTSRLTLFKSMGRVKVAVALIATLTAAQRLKVTMDVLITKWRVARKLADRVHSSQ
jgi:hypothetical protein